MFNQIKIYLFDRITVGAGTEKEKYLLSIVSHAHTQLLFVGLFPKRAQQVGPKPELGVKKSIQVSDTNPIN